MIKAIGVYLLVSLSYIAGFITCAIFAASKEDDNFG